MDDLENLNKALLSILLMQITCKITCRDSGRKNLGEYLNMYIRSNTLLLADVFNNFWNICLEMYDTDPAHFFLAPGLAR